MGEGEADAGGAARCTGVDIFCSGRIVVSSEGLEQMLTDGSATANLQKTKTNWIFCVFVVAELQAQSVVSSAYEQMMLLVP